MVGDVVGEICVAAVGFAAAAGRPRRRIAWRGTASACAAPSRRAVCRAAVPARPRRPARRCRSCAMTSSTRRDSTNSRSEVNTSIATPSSVQILADRRHHRVDGEIPHGVQPDMRRGDAAVRIGESIADTRAPAPRRPGPDTRRDIAARPAPRRRNPPRPMSCRWPADSASTPPRRAPSPARRRR